MKDKREEDSQKATNEYAKIAIGNIREMIEAVDHAAECDGTTDCSACEGTGNVIDTQGDYHDCDKCEGSGSIKCTRGADSDSPESWHDDDKAHERIQEDALSVEVRSDWYTPGESADSAPAEYCILLTTGGPAARIVGDLDRRQPTRARFEYQDWGQPWTEAETTSEEDDLLLQYAQHFYFGEGE